MTVFVQGHRGARGLYPENTLAGFACAMNEFGVKSFELDVHVTRDNVVVVTHDPRLSPNLTRTADSQFLLEKGPLISSLNYTELQMFDVGRLNPDSDYALHFPDQRPIDGERIPRLIDVLNLVRDRAQVTIEVKNVPVSILKEVIDQTPPWDDLIISSFDWNVIKTVHELIPGIPTAALTDDPIHEHYNIVQLVKQLGSTTWSPFYRDITAVHVADAHSQGIAVVPWTVNDVQDMKRMLNIGVDGMITDRPDRLSSPL